MRVKFRLVYLTVAVQFILLISAQLLKPWPLKIIVDSVTSDGATRWLPWADDEGIVVIAATAALVGVHGVHGLLTLWHTRTQLALGRDLVDGLRLKAYARYLATPLRQQAALRAGDVLHRLLADTNQAWDLLTHGLLPMLQATLLVVGMAAVMLSLDPSLTLVAVLVAPALLLLTTRMSRRIDRETRTARTGEGDLFAQAQETVSQLRSIGTFGLERSTLGWFARASQGNLRHVMRVLATQVRHGVLADVIVAAGTSLVLLVGYGRVRTGQLTLGDLVLFAGYLAMLYQPMSTLSQTAGRIANARAALARVEEISASIHPLISGPVSLRPDRTRGHLHVEDLRFSYAADRRVLDGLCLEIMPGEFVGLVGATGAGKTTFFSLLVRLDDPDGGRILLDGVDLRSCELASLRRCFAVLPQPPPVFAGDLRSNIAAGDLELDDASVHEAARRAGLAELLATLPRGLSTDVGERGVNLSEGERQRLALARVLARNAPVVLLDEPTSALDPITEAFIVDGLRTAFLNRTLLIAAHRISTLRTADRILVLDQGRIVEQGPFDDLLALNGRFASLCRAQQPAS